MQKRRCSWLLGLGLCTALTSAVAAGEPPAAPAGGAWRLAVETSLPAGQKLRGFGRCALTFQEFRSGERVLEKTRFRAETQDGARLLAGKFLNDLRQSYQVARKDLDVGGAARPAYVTAGGQALAVMLDGVTVSVLGAPDHATLAAYASWAISPATAEKFGTRGMALTIPFVLYGLAHYTVLAARGRGGRPEKILLHDRRTQLCIALYLATCAAVWLSR